jgi:hypothetical protein
MEGVTIVKVEKGNTEPTLNEPTLTEPTLNEPTLNEPTLNEPTLKRKLSPGLHYEGGDDTKSIFLEKIMDFGKNINEWEDTLEVDWVRRDIEDIVGTAKKLLEGNQRPTKNPQVAPDPITTPTLEPATATPQPNFEVAADLVRMMELTRTTDSSLDFIEAGVRKDLCKTIKTGARALSGLGVAIPEGFEMYLERADVFNEPHNFKTKEEIIATLTAVEATAREPIIAVEPVVALPVVVATEIKPAPEMSMTLLKNGKDTIVKAANDAIKKAYDVLLYGPDELSNEHRVALSDIADENLKILNILGVARD